MVFTLTEPPASGVNASDWSQEWFIGVSNAVEADEEDPGRPLVHFDDEKAGRDRSKARDAARLGVSKANKGEHTNEILAAAADGESVDAYALNEAVLDAMRSATTRLGQSTGRRQMAKAFAHLGHIVQAVLENHADSLPGYEPGERSRALHHQQEVNQSLTRDLTTLKQAASDERRRLCDELEGQDARMAAVIREKTEVGVLLHSAEATLSYAMRMLTAEQVARVEGFRHGFETAERD
jgi:hypothetical protein